MNQTAVEIYGRSSCGRCQGTIARIEMYMEKRGIKGIPVIFYDVRTLNRLEESRIGDLRFKAMPAVIFRKNGTETCRFAELPSMSDISQGIDSLIN